MPSVSKPVNVYLPVFYVQKSLPSTEDCSKHGEELASLPYSFLSRVGTEQARMSGDLWDG